MQVCLNGLAHSTVDSRSPDHLAEHAIFASIVTRRWIKLTGLHEGDINWQVQSESQGESHRCKVMSMLDHPDAIQPATSMEALMDDVREAFHAWDLNGNGELSTLEISDKLQNAGLFSSVDQLNALVTEMDTADHNGVISLSEFTKHFSNLCKDKDRLAAAIKAVFEIIDTDNDDSISVPELQVHLVKFGGIGFVSPQEAGLMLKTLHPHGDGPLDLDAFSKLCNVQEDQA